MGAGASRKQGDTSNARREGSSCEVHGLSSQMEGPNAKVGNGADSASSAIVKESSSKNEISEAKQSVPAKEIPDHQSPSTDEKLSANLLSDMIRKQVEAGLRRKDPAHLKAIFERYKSETGIVANSSLHQIVQELRLQWLTAEEVQESLLSMNVKDSEGLDFEEFQNFVEKPSTLEQYLTSMSLHKLFADAIPYKEGADSMSVFSNLTSAEIDAIISGVSVGLKFLLTNASAKARESQEAAYSLNDKGLSSASKFSAVVMSAGSISDFHEGLSGRIGNPNLSFEKSMRTEHCSKAGSQSPFTTTNYGITTTPNAEWKIVVDRCLEMADMRCGRRIPDVPQLLESPCAVEAGLNRPEVIAVVLYTGPMFTVYNAILRRWPEEIYAPFRDGDNRFPTTIHVLVSSVQKISRAARLADKLPLYRGLGGRLELPPHFFRAGHNGGRGFTEWGFMSTTSNCAVAMQYSGVGRVGGAQPTVLVISVGAVDRGGCVRDLSQYPDEVEYLWLPCSFVAPDGEPRLVSAGAGGLVRMLPVRVNANLKASTTEQLVERKRQMHVTAFRYQLDDLRAELLALATAPATEARWARDLVNSAGGGKGEKPTVAALVERIMSECEGTLARHSRRPAEEYTDDAAFRVISQEMLDSQLFGRSKLHYWLLVDSEKIQTVIGYAPRLCHRLRTARLEKALVLLGDSETDRRRAAALELCQIRGLVQESVGEQNELGEPRLIQAAADSWSKKDLRLLVAAGAELNPPPAGGVTPLYTAAQGGNEECARALVELGAAVNGALPNGVTPLWIAALNGHAACVAALLQLRADVDKPKDNGCTPLYVAAECGFPDCIAALAAAGADANRTDRSGMTPAFIAALNGYAPCVAALRAAGADVNRAKPGNGCTPMYVAAEFGHADAIDALAAAGGDPARPNVNGYTPAHVAAQNGHVGCLRALRRLGVDLHPQDNAGNTPLDVARRGGHEECVALLESL